MRNCSMNKSILFLGGMCGDIILKMIDKESIKPAFIKNKNHFEMEFKKPRIKMKKFWKYSVEQKNLYYSKIEKMPFPYYTMTHDTEYSKNKSDVVQLYCSDSTKIEWFAERFKLIHESFGLHDVVERVCVQQNLSKSNFITEYAELIKNWQDYYVLKNRLDIARIGYDDFIDSINETFTVKDAAWMRYIYNNWKKTNKKFSMQQ